MLTTKNIHSLYLSYIIYTGMNGQPCMVLQTRYFRILDIANLEQPTVSIGEIISEVSAEAYHAGKFGPTPDAFVCAQEVAFDSKGKRACNLSM